jgi:phospholipase D1/2
MTASRILQRGTNTWTRVPADDSGLLVDARDYYYAFFRAARAARRYILMAGWQFDSGVKLVRGPDLARAGATRQDVRLLRFLDGLCERHPSLHIYLLAWDFHMVFALEREWMQKLWFDTTTNERLRFQFDDTNLPGGCHHQKFVVIDGRLSFLGGIDICEARWDDRRHLGHNPERLSRGRPQRPYHDVQAYFRGARVADALTGLFRERWRRAGGGALALPAAVGRAAEGRSSPRGALRFPAGASVSLSRTEPTPAGKGPLREIRALYAAAIARARQLIYIETQYFSSRAVCRALVERLRDRALPALEVVLVLNLRAEAVKEEIAVGLRQTEIVSHLRQVAREAGHRLGVYYTVPAAGGRRPGKHRSTYMHSKLMVVDDRFLTVGSANLTNRSMGIDSELNASWESPGPDGPLAAAIRRARVSLLGEHLGLQRAGVLARLGRPAGLVAYLDGLVQAGEGRLRAQPGPTRQEARVLEVIDPQALPFDPEAADDEETLEYAEEHPRSLFKLGLSALWDRLTGGDPQPRRREQEREREQQRTGAAAGAAIGVK